MYFPIVKGKSASMGRRSSKLWNMLKLNGKSSKMPQNVKIQFWPRACFCKGLSLPFRLSPGRQLLSSEEFVSNFTTYPWNVAEICTASMCAGLHHASITAVSWGTRLNYTAIVKLCSLCTPMLLPCWVGWHCFLHTDMYSRARVHPQDRNPEKPVLLRLQQNKSNPMQREVAYYSAVLSFFSAGLHVLNRVLPKFSGNVANCWATMKGEWLQVLNSLSSPFILATYLLDLHRVSTRWSQALAAVGWIEIIRIMSGYWELFNCLASPLLLLPSSCYCVFLMACRNKHHLISDSKNTLPQKVYLVWSDSSGGQQKSSILL